MKALLRKEWMSYIRDNIVWLFILVIIYVLINSSMWFTVIDSTLILYALAVSPVLGMLKGFADGWHMFEKFTWKHNQRAAARYLIALGYCLAAGIIVLLLSHDLFSAFYAILGVLAIISPCLAAYFLPNASRKAMILVLFLSVIGGLPTVLTLDARVISQIVNNTYYRVEIPDLSPFISIYIPLGVIVLSFLYIFSRPAE